MGGHEGGPGSPDRRRRVLILIKGLGLGGAERLVVEVVAHADHARYEYEVAYVLAEQNTLAPELRAEGVAVHDLGAKGSTDIRWTWRLRRLLTCRRFDVLHSHLPYTAALGRLVAASIPRSRRPLLVYTEHSLWDRAAVVTKALNSATIGLDGALITVSPASREALPPRLRARAKVVVHGVDQQRCSKLLADRDAVRRAVRTEIGVPSGDLLALTVANLRREKGYDTLVDAAREVVDAGAPVFFACVGWGPLEDELNALRASSGLEDHLRLLGKRPDVLRLMAAADLFVLPSHQEGLPVALMEAMSMGLAVVATAVGGVGQLVTTGEDGLIVPPGRPDSLAEAIVRLTKDEQLRARLGRAALAGSNRFDVRSASKAIEDVYDRLIESGAT